MSTPMAFSAFISYTADDLAAHADIVASVLRKLKVFSIDHRDSGATGEPSVVWCFEQIEKSDILIVLVAHRYGWIPPKNQGGDDSKSITWMEVEYARKKGKIVLPYLIDESATWQVDLVEGLKNPKILPLLNSFKDELRKNVCAFFFEPKSLDGPVSRDVPNALRRLPKLINPKLKTLQNSDAVFSETIPLWFYDQHDPPSVMDRMKPELPKRILCMEGGSTDCFIILGYLEKLEKLLTLRYGDNNFRIANYYDLIIGNGFTSPLAVELALGNKVSEIEPVFREIIQSYFSKKSSILKRFNYMYNPEPLYSALKSYYGNYTLASEELKTGVALVVTRFDQSTPWHFLNHKDWEHYDSLSNIKMDQLLKGCMAMPSYMPYVILGTPNLGDIVVGDGGFAIGNDSSLYALSLVSNYAFPYKWRFGENRLSITTIGSKGKRSSRVASEFKDIHLLKQMPLLIETLLSGATANSEALISGLAGNETTGISKIPILTSHRFDILLSSDSIRNLGLSIEHDIIDNLFQNATSNNTDYLIKIGRLAADKQISMTHFNSSFDVRDLSTLVMKS